MNLLYGIGKIMVLLECLAAGMMSWFYMDANFQLHPLFRIAITIAIVLLCFATLSRTNIVCRIAQVALGVGWGYNTISPFALSFVEKPDTIWKIGILVMSVIVCVSAQFLFANVSELNRQVEE